MASTTQEPVNLFVNYVPLTVSDEDLRDLFLPHATIVSAKIMRHIPFADIPSDASAAAAPESSRKSKGYGFVLVATSVDATRCIDALNGFSIGGKRLAVRVAQRLPTDYVPPPAPSATVPCSPARLSSSPSSSSDVLVSPVDPSCGMTGISAVFEAYGTVSGARKLANGTAVVTFVHRDDAENAVATLNGALVPRIAARHVLTVGFHSAMASSHSDSSDLGEGGAKAAASSSQARQARRSSRRAELVPSAETLSFNPYADWHERHAMSGFVRPQFQPHHHTPASSHHHADAMPTKHVELPAPYSPHHHHHHHQTDPKQFRHNPYGYRQSVGYPSYPYQYQQ